MIGFLWREFFHQEMGQQVFAIFLPLSSIKSFSVFVIILFLLFLGEGHREECFIKLRRKKKLAQVSSLGIMITVQMGVIALVYQVSGIGSFVLNELSLEPCFYIRRIISFLLARGDGRSEGRGWLRLGLLQELICL